MKFGQRRAQPGCAAASPGTCAIGAAARSTRSGPTDAGCSPPGNACRARASPRCGIAISAEDPSAQILSAWIAKEELRTLLSTVRVGGDAHLTRHRLHRLLTWCVDSQIPELLTLATTVDAWWPEIDAFVRTGITNARTEGYNRLVKQVKRVGCGYRNTDNSMRRIRFHCTRHARRAAQTSC